LKKYASCTARIFRFTGTNGIALTGNSVTADLQGVTKILKCLDQIQELIIYVRKKKIMQTVFQKGVVFEFI